MLHVDVASLNQEVCLAAVQGADLTKGIFAETFQYMDIPHEVFQNMQSCLANYRPTTPFYYYFFLLQKLCLRACGVLCIDKRENVTYPDPLSTV